LGQDPILESLSIGAADLACGQPAYVAAVFPGAGVDRTGHGGEIFAAFDARFGSAGDLPLPGDYDGDGRQDLTVYRPSSGTWFWLKSSTANTDYAFVGWGLDAQGDVPVPGDYDGDGKWDPTVYRPAYGTWFILRSASAFTQYWGIGWGQPTDVPLGGYR
jgi:hypothetical protein